LNPGRRLPASGCERWKSWLILGESVVRSAADHGAQFLGTRILYLQPGTREHFRSFLKSEYPTLLAEYRRLFPGSYAPKRFQEGIRANVQMLKELHDLWDQPAKPPRVLQQLALLPTC
jgi:hypothetical protein